MANVPEPQWSGRSPPLDVAGGLTIVRYDFAFDTPNIDTGVVVHAVETGDVLLNTSYFIVSEEWEDDGNTLYPSVTVFAEGEATSSYTANVSSGSLTPTTTKLAFPKTVQPTAIIEFLANTNVMLAVADMIPGASRGRATFVGMFADNYT